jgi:hypothetical protein
VMWDPLTQINIFEWEIESKYHFIVLRFKDNKYYGYYNWKNIWEEKLNWIWDTSILNIWTQYNSVTKFDWIVDDVKIYNRALSDDEILQQAKIAGF